MPANASTGIIDGRQTVTTAATRVQLSTASIPCKEIVITAETDNTDYVVVGGDTVVAALATRRGTPLSAGQSLVLDISDANLVYLDAMVDTEGVTYVLLRGE